MSTKPGAGQTAEPAGESDENFDEADHALDAKFTAFKKQNLGRTLHDAAKVVRNFMVWQHNFASIEMPDDRTDEQEAHAERIERAFLLSAAGMAAEGFSLGHADEALFMLNIVGMYKGLGPGDAENEVARIFEAGDVEKKANRIGAASLVEYLVNGKSDTHRVHLAALQRECWSQ